MTYFLSTALLINFLILFNYTKIFKILNLYDIPDNKRKIHTKKVPLAGGTIILINLILYIFFDFFFYESFFSNTNLFSILFGSILFYLLGFYDDKKNLNPNFKFLLQFFFSFIVILIDKDLIIKKIIFLSFNSTFILDEFSFIFTILCIIIFINALNMFDGINLQAGLYCSTIFLIISIITNFSLFNISILISLITFLILNLKNKSFLGDNGSNLLGFIVSYIVIFFSNNNDFNFFTADQIFLIMLIPGLDLLRLFCIRLAKKKHPFSADNLHFHHILLKKFSFFKTTFLTQSLIAIPIFLLLILEGDKTGYIILGATIIYLIIIKKYAK